MDFSSAHNEAIKTMLSSCSIEKKLLAAKIRILCVLHLNSFFESSKRAMNMSLIKDFVMQTWSETVGLAEIKTAIGDEYEPSVFRNGLLMVLGEGHAACVSQSTDNVSCLLLFQNISLT